MLRLSNVIPDFFSRENSSTSRDLLVLLAVFGFIFFFMLGRQPLSDPDESRYAEVPREMIELGDYITPRLNYVEYFEKPPLLYWMNALSFSVFGQNEFAARFPSALCGLFGVLLVSYVGRKIFDRRSGMIAALVLGSSAGYVTLSRSDITDIPLTFFLTASLGFFLLSRRTGEKHRPLYGHLFFVSAAFAVLAKGLIGIVLPGTIIFVYVLAGRRRQVLRDIPWITGIPIFLLIAAPWFIVMSLRHPEFPRFFFIHEHFARYLTTVHGRYQPFWFFLPVLIGLMIPWSLLCPSVAVRLWRGRTNESADTVLFLALWVVIIFLFFSLSHSKLVPYILPVVPPAALLMGKGFSSVLDQDASRAASEMRGVGLVLTVIGVALIAFLWRFTPGKIGGKEATVIGGMFVGMGVLLLTVLWRQPLRTALPLIVLAACAIGVTVPLLAMEDIAEWKSTKSLGLIVRKEAGNDALVASCGMYEQGFSFYSRKRVVLVDERNELDFGSRQENTAAWFISASRFAGQWDSSVPVYALIHAHDLAPFSRTVHKPVHVLGKNGDKLLITNR